MLTENRQSNFRPAGHSIVGFNTTFCEDTPDNWQHFEKLKNRIIHGPPKQLKKMPRCHKRHGGRRKPIIFYGYNTI